MRAISAIILLLCFLAMLAQPVIAREKRFADATETNQRLMNLYEQAGDICLRNTSRDVRVAVACISMTVYGLALNERGLCYGKRDEANAFKKWHECQEDSDRFSESTLTSF